MKKIITIVLVCMVMLIGVMPYAMADASDVVFDIVPNKTDVNPGDTITYTISVTASKSVCCWQFYLDIPEGMTYVAGSGAVDANLKSTLNDAENNIGDVSYTESQKMFFANTGALEGFNPTNFIGKKITIGTFQCTVNSDAVGAQSVGLEFDVLDDADLVSYLDEGNYTVSEGSVSVICEHSSTEIQHAKDATCSAEGYTGDVVCKACGETVTTGSVIEKKPHTPKAAVKENEVEPDCTNPGSYDEVVYCDVCDAEISRTTVPVEALGHTPKAAVKENEVAPGCEVAGSYDNVVYCDVCDAELSRTTVPVAPTDHDWGDWTKVLAPTCSAEGKETRTCKNDATHTQEQAIAIDPTAHKWGDWVETKAPTCSAQGEKERVCEYNADHKEPGTVPVDPLAHNYEAVVTAPTCTEKGYTTYTCSHNSEHSYVDDYVNAKGHTDDPESVTWSWEGYSQATCTTVCGVCGTVTTEKAVIEVGTSTAKDCTEVGKTTYVAKATVNGVEYTDEKTVEGAAGPHDWSDWTVTTEPTCTEAGEETRVCSHNSDHKETRPVEATGHNYEAVVTAPTCTEQGYTTYTCGACGDTYVADYVEATGHNYEAVVTAPTCTEQGYTTYTCDACGDTYVADYVPATDHDWGDWTETKAPTCVAKGEEQRVCKNDAEHIESRDVEIDPDAHDLGMGASEGKHWDVCGREGCGYESDPVDCTFDENKYKFDDNQHWIVCDVCGMTEKGEHEDHAWGEWVTEQAPTATKDGYALRQCEICGLWGEKTLPATGGGSGSGSDKDNSNIPDTGDDAPIALMAAVLTVCAAGVVVLTSKKRKNEN